MKEKEQKKQNFKNKVSGEKALDILYEELDKDGLLLDSKGNISLNKRIEKLELEVDLLKDLIARALGVKNKKVLKG